MLGSCHILAANMTLAFNRLHMLSPEGACKAFDAAGNGCACRYGSIALLQLLRWLCTALLGADGVS